MMGVPEDIITPHTGDMYGFEDNKSYLVGRTPLDVIVMGKSLAVDFP